MERRITWEFREGKPSMQISAVASVARPTTMDFRTGDVRGAIVLIPIPGGSLDRSDLSRVLATSRREAQGNGQALADAQRAVEDVTSYYRSIGVRPEEGAGPIRVEYDPTFDNAAYVPGEDLMIIGRESRSGKSYAASRDVVAHELGHRVATATGALVPGASDTNSWNGAVQEHLADVFAAAYDRNWTLGEGLGTPIRDMKDPQRLGHPGTVDELKARLQDGSLLTVQVDQRGNRTVVPNWHNVAEVPNRAAYLIGSRIGQDSMAKLYLDTMRNFATPNMSLKGLADAVVLGAEHLFGADSQATKITKDAWRAVGLLR